ncbi:MAG: hypothetical protein ACR2PB_01220 [Desulfocapsaceae bacterium]
MNSSGKMGVFHSLRSRIDGWFHTGNPENQFVDHVINIIEPKLKLAKNYRKRLRQPLEICREHCRALVAEIPGPIQLRRNGYGGDPFVRAAFTKSEFLEDLLNQADLSPSSAQLSGTARVALLTMTSREKTIFGRKQFGDLMVADAAMRAVTFTDHTIVGLSESVENSRKALEKHSLDILVEAAARELSEVRTRLVDLNQRQEWLRAMEKMFGTGTGAGMGCVFVPYDPEKAKKKKEVELLLAETEEEIVSARSRTETPDDWLTIVENILSKPDAILNMQRISLRLNWKNVLTDDPSEKADTITFATFTLADEMQREGVLVEYEQS